MARGRIRIGHPAAGDMTFDELNAAPILRGTVKGNKWAGVQEGLGLSSSARQQNAVALQAAIDYAAANQMFFEMDQGIFEIENADGLVIPAGATGFVWRAPLTCTILQANPVPILTIGGLGSVNETFGIDFYGCSLNYLADYSASTTANALQLGNLWLCQIAGIRIASTITNSRSYRGIYIPSGRSFFSNTIEDVKVFRSAFSLLHIGNFGTGNLYENIYLSGVNPSGQANACERPFYWFQASSNQMHDSVFNQLNIEWCISQNLINTANVRGAVFNSVHIEQNRLTGAHPTMVSANISNLQFDSLMSLDNRYETALASGEPSFIRTFGESTVHVTNMNVIINNSTYMNIPTSVHLQGTSDGRTDSPSRVTIDNLRLLDSTGTSLRDNVQIDHRLNNTAYGTPKYTSIGRVESGEPITTVERAVLDLTSSYTLYGAIADKVFIRYPVNLAADCTLTLSNMMGPSGTEGSGVPIPEGTIIAVRRRGGTIVNTLVIENYEGTDLVTSTTQSVTYRFKFSGGNWSLIV